MKAYQLSYMFIRFLKTYQFVLFSTGFIFFNISCALACVPDSNSEKPWKDVLRDDYSYADTVFVGHVIEVNKIYDSKSNDIAIDRIKFSVEESIKGNMVSSDFAETQNIDGLPSACGYRLGVGERVLILLRDKQIVRAISATEPWDTSDSDITIKTINGFRNEDKLK